MKNAEKFNEKDFNHRISLSVFLLSSLSFANENQSTYHPEPWDNLGSNMVWSVVGWPLLLHTSAGGATYLLIESNTDAKVQRLIAKQDVVLNAITTAPGMIAGTFVPVVLPATLYFFPKDDEWKASGAVTIQAVGISFLYNNILKATTNRAPPDPDGDNPERLSRDFKFGFLRRGVFFGWPSGHTMTNTAMATSIYAYNRDKAWALPSAIAYSTYIGVSMTMGAKGRAHWLSDAVAGLLMGAGIGWTVGDSFYKEKQSRHSQKASASHLSLVPIAGNASGLLALYQF